MEEKIPSNAVQYCCELWKKYKFSFFVTQKRNTKYGDYRYDQRRESHTITINHDLNQYAFLITYIHEVAHRTTQKIYGSTVRPHGNEWKDQFRSLMNPMLSANIFPSDVLNSLKSHMQNPKASSCSDPQLYLALETYNKKRSDLFLRDIAIGYKFLFNNRVFKKMEVKRTRSLCQCNATNKMYLISEIATIQAFKN